MYKFQLFSSELDLTFRLIYFGCADDVFLQSVALSGPDFAQEMFINLIKYRQYDSIIYVDLKMVNLLLEKQGEQK